MPKQKEQLKPRARIEIITQEQAILRVLADVQAREGRIEALLNRMEALLKEK